MALTINRSRISDTAWGDVDKTALGNKLATAYAAGDATKAQIRFVYLHVPDEAFGKDADGEPEFSYTKAKLPVCQVSGSEIVLNRNGVHAAASALAGGRTPPDLSGSEMAAAKRKLRGMYRKLKEKTPDSMKESTVLRIGRGTPIEEKTKGSLEYTLEEIWRAFKAQFQEMSPYGEMWCPYSVEDTFVDAIIVRERYSQETELAPDEFYRVTYTHDGTAYTFAAYDQWEVVELTYQPQSTPSASAGMVEGKQGDKEKGRKGGKRFVEVLDAAQMELVETADAQDAKPDGPWRIKAIGNTADVVNGNGRRRRAAVLAASVEELRGHLHESAGQGRLIQRGTTGEPDHPRDKGNRHPLLTETVVNWDTVSFDGKHVLLEGNLLGTAKGKDIRAQMRGGVIPGISQRSYGDSVIVQENGASVEEVTQETITGYDFTRPNDQSDADAGVTMFETRDDDAAAGRTEENEDMTKEELEKWVKEHPELFKGMLTEEIGKMGADQLKAFEETVRKTMGIAADADLGGALRAAMDAQKELTERKRIEARDKAIDETVKDLKYGKLNEAFKAELAEMAAADDGSKVKAFAESLRKRYDAMLAQMKLAGMGYRGQGVQVVGPVLESETGTPEFARGAFEFTESLVKRAYIPRRDLAKPKTVNEIFTAQVLERFDTMYKAHLFHESKLLEEAEQVSDLGATLPFSVSRAIIAAAFPMLIAVSVFDVQTTDQAPTRIYYESYASETGVDATVSTPEAVVADIDEWVAMAQKRLKPGTAVIKDVTDAITYVEGSDYVIDYGGGRFKALATIVDGATVHATYQYLAIRKGEFATIERGKGQLSYKTLEVAADRLATQLTSEVVTFARSQIGWDATTRTLNMLINEIRRKIDGDLFYLGLAAALSVANNSGGAWATTDDAKLLVKYIGIARVKVAMRFYEPNSILLSEANSDLLGNWDSFTAAGKRPDSDLTAEGYVGRLKGLPVFKSTQFPDGYSLVLNRELVAHRIYQPMVLKGPYPSYSGAASTSLKLVAADQWYAEEFNGSEAPVAGKGAVVTIS